MQPEVARPQAGESLPLEHRQPLRRAGESLPDAKRECSPAKPKCGKVGNATLDLLIGGVIIFMPYDACALEYMETSPNLCYNKPNNTHQEQFICTLLTPREY